MSSAYATCQKRASSRRTIIGESNDEIPCPNRAEARTNSPDLSGPRRDVGDAVPRACRKSGLRGLNGGSSCPPKRKLIALSQKRPCGLHRSPFRRPGYLGLSAEIRWLCVPALRKVCHCRGRNESLQGSFAVFGWSVGLV